MSPLGKLWAPGHLDEVAPPGRWAAPRPACRTGRACPARPTTGRAPARARRRGAGRACPGRCSGKAEQERRVGLERPAVRHATRGAGAAATDDERPRQRGPGRSRAPRRSGTQAASSVGGRPATLRPATSHGCSTSTTAQPAPTSTSRAMARSIAPSPPPAPCPRTTVPRAPGGPLDVGASGPAGRLDLADRLTRTGAAHAPTTSPVIGSTTPSSSARRQRARRGRGRCCASRRPRG